MKDTYTNQGKNYISSKRASEISDYSSDYVGQLCREGKLDCDRVGHIWFITEDSLRAHMTRVWSEDALRGRANNLKKRSIKEPRRSAEVAQAADDVKRISSKQAALFSGYAPDYIGQLCRSGKLDAVMIGKTWFVVEDSLKSHMDKIREEALAKEQEAILKGREALLKAQQAQRNQAKKEFDDLTIGELKDLSRMNFSSMIENEGAIRAGEKAVANMQEWRIVNGQRVAVSPMQNATLGHKLPAARLSRFHVAAIKSVVYVVLFMVLVGAGSFSFVKVFNKPNNATSSPIVANVYDAAVSITNILTRAFISIAAIITGTHDLAINLNSANNTNTGADRGMAVVPATGSDEGDAALKGAIKQSFSDEVNILPDADNSGSTGVIKPVFKNVNSKDFMYVMVPVNTGKNDPP